MRRVYPALLTKTNDSKDTVLVEVPDLDIATEGYGLEDAIYMARDAIGLTGITRQDEGRDIAEASDISSIEVSAGRVKDEGDTIVTLVDIDFDEYRRKYDNRSVRRNVSIPYWLDQEARNAGLNVSKVLQDALKERLGVE